MGSSLISPPVPRIDAALYRTPVIPGGYHGLYNRLSPETRALIDAWVQYAMHLLPTLGIPITTERNVRGTVDQAAIVTNGRGAVTTEKMANLVIYLHQACLERRRQVHAVIASKGAGREHVTVLAERVCEDFEVLRGGLDPLYCDPERDILEPLINKHLCADAATGHLR